MLESVVRQEISLTVLDVIAQPYHIPFKSPEGNVCTATIPVTLEHLFAQKSKSIQARLASSYREAP